MRWPVTTVLTVWLGVPKQPPQARASLEESRHPASARVSAARSGEERRRMISSLSSRDNDAKKRVYTDRGEAAQNPVRQRLSADVEDVGNPARRAAIPL